MSLRKLRVDMDDILDAMEAYGDAPFSYLHTGTGNVEVWVDPDLNDGEPLFDPDDEGWVEIPRQEARDLHQAMEHFAESLDEEDVVADLRVALRSRGAFRCFRDVLARHPDLRERWQADHHEQLLRQAIEWLRTLGIEPTYQLRLVTRPPSTPRQSIAPAPTRIGLADLLLLGSPNGKTELLDGHVNRMIQTKTPDQARGLFTTIARELTEQSGIGWRKRFVEGRDAYEIGRFHLWVEGDQVWLAVVVPRAIWDAFR